MVDFISEKSVAAQIMKELAPEWTQDTVNYKGKFFFTRKNITGLKLKKGVLCFTPVTNYSPKYKGEIGMMFGKRIVVKD